MTTTPANPEGIKALVARLRARTIKVFDHSSWEGDYYKELPDEDAIEAARLLKATIPSEDRVREVDVGLLNDVQDTVIDWFREEDREGRALVVERLVRAYEAAIAPAPSGGEQEPVAHVADDERHRKEACTIDTYLPIGMPLYAHPAPEPKQNDAKPAESTVRDTWPERLTLRDTKIAADEGQRIYTTATGHGYEKRDYVRADLANSTPEASDAVVAAWLRDGAWYLPNQQPSARTLETFNTLADSIDRGNLAAFAAKYRREHPTEEVGS